MQCGEGIGRNARCGFGERSCAASPLFFLYEIKIKKVHLPPCKVCGRFAIICGVRARKVLPDNKDKERNKTMIAMTTKNGRYVRLTASYDIEAGTATYTVQGSGGVNMTFIDFGSAAREYRRLSDEIEYGKEVA